MSALLVGLFSIFIAPSELTFFTAITLSTRDILLASTRVFLMLQLSSTFDIASLWCIIDIIGSIARCIRNPLQLQSNTLRNVASEQLTDYQKRIVSIFSLDNRIQHCFNQPLYVTLDWLTYLIYLFGIWLLGMQLPTTERNPRYTLLMNICRYEFAITLCVVGGLFVLYVVLFLLNKCTGGFCLTGFDLDGRNWPQSCPRVIFHTSLWRRRGESLQEYRSRRRITMATTYAATPGMMGLPTGHENGIELSNRVLHLSEAELNQLRTFVYHPEESKESGGQNMDSTPKPVVIVIPPASRPRNDHTDVAELPTPDTITLGSEQDELINQGKDGIEDAHGQESGQHHGSRTTDTICALCLCDYEEGDRLRELVCLHCFHAHCVDEWLLKNKRTCPVCARDAVQDPEQEHVESQVSETSSRVTTAWEIP